MMHMRSPKKDTPIEEKKATRITVTLPISNYETIVRMAKSKKVSTAWVVREAVEKYLGEDMPLFRERTS